MEQLIPILIFVAAAIISAILKKKTPADDPEDIWPDESASPTPPHREQTPAKPTAVGWEEELKQLLEGRTGSSPSEPSPPPPVFIPPPVAPPPIPAAPSKRLHQWGESKKASGTQFTNLQAARDSLQKARKMQGRVSDQVRDAALKFSKYGLEARVNKTSNEIKEVKSWFRTPRSARKAFIASVILESPKGLKK